MYRSLLFRYVVSVNMRDVPRVLFQDFDPRDTGPLSGGTYRCISIVFKYSVPLQFSLSVVLENVAVVLSIELKALRPNRSIYRLY